MSRAGPSSRPSTARTSSRVRTTGSRSGRRARTTSSSHGSCTPSTSRYRKSKCAQRLVLGGRGDVTVHGERRQEPCDLRRAHLGRVPLAVKEDVPPDPADVCVLGAAAVVASADGGPGTVEKAGGGGGA